MDKSKWSWHFGKGLSWAMPIGAGALFGVRTTLANAAAFNNDYTPMLFVLAAAGLALWLGGYKRIVS